MFERAPREPEWASWLGVGLWSLLLFALVPIARALEDLVEGTVGRAAFLYVVLAAFGLGAALVLRRLRDARGVSPIRWLVVGLLTAFYGRMIWQLRESPVEALHFVLFGVLGLLALRALGHRVRDASAYVGAALIGAGVGIVDEGIQWATPERVWDLRDIGFNFVGAGAVQIAVAAGIRPATFAARPSAASVRRVCGIAAGVTLLMALSLLNTPPRIAAYTARVPGLASLGARPDVMVEYGYLYEDPELGVFRSRLAPAELARTDAERGESAGEIVRAFAGDAKAFIAHYTVIRDPFLHEFRVHLFRRDRYLESSSARRPGTRKWRENLTVAHRENGILERYFPVTLRHSGAVFPPDEARRLAEHQDPETHYESRVSEGLVTRFSERHVAIGAALVWALLAAGALAAGRRERTEERG